MGGTKTWRAPAWTHLHRDEVRRKETRIASIILAATVAYLVLVERAAAAYESVEACLQDDVLAPSECHRLYGGDNGLPTIVLVALAVVAVALAAVAVRYMLRRRRSSLVASPTHAGPAQPSPTTPPADGSGASPLDDLLARERAAADAPAQEPAQPPGAAMPPAPSQVEPIGAESIEVNKAGVGLALGGAVLMVIACFLPRVESTKFFQVVDNTLVASGDGFIFIGLAVIVVAATYRLYQQGSQSWVVCVLGLLGIALAVYNGTGDALELESVGGSSLNRVTETASPGVGIYAAGVGAAMVAYGGLLLAGRGIWPAAAQAPARPTRACPDCAETVLAEARVCKHCGYRFDAPT